MRRLPIVLLLLVAAACATHRSQRYIQWSGLVEVTAEKTAAAFQAGHIDRPTAQKIAAALHVADAALDAYAASFGRSDPQEIKDLKWQAAEQAVLALAGLAEQFLGADELGTRDINRILTERENL